MGEEKDKYPKRAMLVVSDFPNVFPDELPRLPPRREVQFTIDLYLETEKGCLRVEAVGHGRD